MYIVTTQKPTDQSGRRETRKMTTVRCTRNDTQGAKRDVPNVNYQPPIRKDIFSLLVLSKRTWGHIWNAKGDGITRSASDKNKT